MTVKEHDQSIQSGVYQLISENSWWRTGEYGFYRRGFEKKTIPLGAEITYVEGGVSWILEIPDVPIEVNGKRIGLRQAIGMGVIPLEKLEIKDVNDKESIVSVTSNFDPRTDLEVVNIMRPSGWGGVDTKGRPLKSMPSNESNLYARYSYVLHKNNFDEGPTGWHGSFARGVNGFYCRAREVSAGSVWSYGSGVMLVDREEAAADLCTKSTCQRIHPYLCWSPHQ
ncbi:MAG: hypothetical protein AB1391_03595 [Candidatus Micrarchaeota archaeon]